jgi:hypothetical protein
MMKVAQVTIASPGLTSQILLSVDTHNPMFTKFIHLHWQSIWKKCNKKVMAILQKDGTIDKVKRLHKIVCNMESTDEACQLHKEIWTSQQQAELEVANGLWKIHTGACPNSPAVAGLVALKSLWSYMICCQKHPEMDSRQIHQLIKKCKNQDTFNISLEEAWLWHKQVWHCLRQVHEKTIHVRQTYLNGLAEALSKKKMTKAASELKNLKARENSKTTGTMWLLSSTRPNPQSWPKSTTRLSRPTLVAMQWRLWLNAWPKPYGCCHH